MQYSLLPRFLQVELTYDCNSKCTFCYNPHHLKKDDEDKRVSILKTVNSYEIDHVQLIGGEVTILPNLPQYLDILDSVRWKSIVTNGRVFVPRIIGKVNEIYLSLHGDENFHEKITRAKDSFKTIEESIRKYVSAGIVVHSDTCLTKENAHMIFDIAFRAKSLGMDTLFVNIFQPAGIGSYTKIDNSPSIQQVRDCITQMIAAKKELDINVEFGTSTPFCLDERLITDQLAFRCGTGDWFASINPSGDLRICNQSKKSYGNILTEQLHTIWHSKDVNSDYRSLEWMEEPCNSCIFKNDCLGGCRIDDSGKARIDLMVLRDKDYLVAKSKLTELYETFKSNTYYQPYVG